MTETRKCAVCGSLFGVRLYQILVDGMALNLSFELCNIHGDAYLINAGKLIGEMLRKWGT